MKRFQKKFDTSILFITHNLGLASKVCDKIAVMYAGKIFEFADAKDLFRYPGASLHEKSSLICPEDHRSNEKNPVHFGRDAESNPSPGRMPLLSAVRDKDGRLQVGNKI